MPPGKLNALAVNRLGPGNHGDGSGGLYLRVAGNSRTWAFRYRRSGKQTWLSLGRLADYSLAEARHRARECRRQLHEGIDPAEARRQQRTVQVVSRTFAEVATLYIEAHQAGWRNAKHGKQWQATLDQHAAGLMQAPVSSIGVTDVLAVLQPIWSTKTETASRVRGRIEVCLDYATARHWRTGDNPARWKGHLDALLPARTRVAKVEHHAALLWAAVPALMERLAASKGTAARCLAFLILTAARSGEARGARWSEIDYAGATWSVPASRMKGGRLHRVPLSPQALALLGEAGSPDALVFPGGRVSSPLSDVSMNKALKVAGGAGVTVHGFRSSFRDWCGEVSAVPREVAEAALAHVNKDRVEAAYARSDLFERRRQLMADWAEHCNSYD